jgi:surface protein
MSVIGGQNPIVQDGLVYILDFGNQRSYVSGSSTAQSLIYNPVEATFVAPLPGAYSGLAAAYSVRKVVPGYTGYAMEVQSGSVSASIGFDSFGNLDTASLESFAGSGDAFVKTWFDQSGNGNNAFQNTLADQPKIYSGSLGSVILENGKPIISKNDSWLNLPFDLNTRYKTFAVLKNDYPSSNILFGSVGSNDDGTLTSQNSTSTAIYFGATNNALSKNGTPYNPVRRSDVWNTLTSQSLIYDDTTYNFNNSSNSGIGYFNNSFNSSFYQLQELIIYSSSAFFNINIIENSINSYYQIYSPYNPIPDPDLNSKLLEFNNQAITTNQSFPGFSYNQGNLTLIFTGQPKGDSTFIAQDGTVAVMVTTSSIGYGSSENNLGRTFPISDLSHVSLRFTTGSVDCFVDGIPTAPDSIFPSASAGNLNNLTIPRYSGSLGNLLVYNRELTDDEIYAIYLQQARRYGLPEVEKPYTVDSSVYAYTQAAGITGSSVITALDAFVSGLKANNLWNKMIAIYPFLGSDTIKTRFNLKDPSLNTTAITYSGSWSASDSGSYNNNTSSYGIMENIKADYYHPLISSESIHLSYLSYDTPVSGGYLMGVEETPGLPGDIAAPAAAYSVRKVKSDYTGSAMNIRRDVDNLTFDVGFDGNGNLDTGSLLTKMVEPLGTPTLPGDYSGLAAAYSLRKVSSSYSGYAVEVRREVDNYSSSIGFDGSGNLNTASLASFIRTGSETPIDAYSGLKAAYSLRKVVPTYGGDVIEIQSGSVSQSIGFNSFGDLDVVAIRTFAGSGDAFVKTWYDQSGNNDHITQSNTVRQPQIYDGAQESVLTQGGKPAMYFNGSVITTLNMPGLHGHSVLDQYFVVSTDNPPQYLYPNNSNTLPFGFVAQNGSTSNILTSGYGSPSLYANGNILTENTRNGVYDLLNGYKIAVHQGADTSTWSSYNFSFYGGISFYYTGYLQELIAYTSSQADNRTYIENNINSYYGIYTPTSVSTENAYVKTWYDQSGNGRHATQTATGSQPLIVSSGSLIIQNGKPAINFRRANSSKLTLPVSSYNMASDFAVLNQSGSIGNFDTYIAINTLSNQIRLATGPFPFNTIYHGPGDAYQDGRLRTSSDSYDDIRNTRLYSAHTSSAFSFTQLRFGGRLNTTQDDVNANIQEYLFFSTPQTASRDLIEDNINGYYNIFTHSLDSGSGYVTTWYDQSGNNRHATQTTASNQPLILSSGSVNLINTKPGINFGYQGTSAAVKLATATFSAGITSPYTVFTTFKTTLDASQTIYDGLANPNQFNYNTNGYNLYNNDNTSGVLYGTGTTNQQTHIHIWGPQLKGAQNTSAITTGATRTDTLDGISLGHLRNPAFSFAYQFEGSLQEAIFYASDQSSNRAPIQQDINKYFNIFTPLLYNQNINSLSLFSSPNTVAGAANNVASASFTTGGPTGLITVSRTGSSDYTLWKNRVPTRTALPASTPLSNEIYLNAANLDNALFSSSQNNVSYASVGAGLTDDEVYTYYELVDNLQISLNRGVVDPNAFITVWDTRISGTGTVTGTSSIALPLFGTQAITASWGDGSVSLISSSVQVDRTHSYSESGIYTVTITGEGQGFRFNTGGDRLKLMDIVQWGFCPIAASNTFDGCSNLLLSAADAPSSITSLSSALRSMPNFNAYLNNWDISANTSLFRTFVNNSKFNSPLDKWDVSNVTSFRTTFTNCQNFNQPIGNWNVSKADSFCGNNGGFLQGAASFDQDLGSWNVSNVIGIGNNAGFQSMFSGASRFNNGGSPSINNWRFNTSSDIGMNNMFTSATSFNQNIGSWNVEKVVEMGSMFDRTRDFNNSGSSDINNWRPISCSNFSLMFRNSSFNQPIGNWPLSASSINMSSMFLSNTAFNQNIGSWDVSNVTLMNNMFNNADAFNQNIGSWNVEKVTNMQSMFNGTRDFNNSGSADINNWRPISCSSFNNMFSLATAFNQPIGNWPLSASNINMSSMFQNANNFDQDIGSWDVSNVTTMTYTFDGSDTFNNGGSPNINNWTPVSCSSFQGTFQNTPFNQPVEGWTLATDRAVDLSYMFRNASSFNQPLGDWNIVSCSNMSSMFDGSGIDIPNYTKTLRGWGNLANTTGVQTAVPLGATGKKYGAAHAQRKILTDTYGWTITDGGQEPFVFTINTTASGYTAGTELTFTLPLTQTTYNGYNLDILVDWGDGQTSTISQSIQADKTHTYSNSGSYEITITGSLFGFKFNNGGDKAKVTDVNKWSAFESNQDTVFYGCSNLVGTATDAPLITSTNLSQYFRSCVEFNGNIGSWDVSNVRIFSETFDTTPKFNNGGSDSIKNWNTSNVTSMNSMFRSSTIFNQPIGNWDTSNVTTMRNMFVNAIAFNQDIGAWNTSAVTTMSDMFQGATAFNQNIGAWNVSMVISFVKMFYNATAFNNGGSDDIDNWTFSTISDINMSNMFSGLNTTTSCKFNRYIGSWNTERVTDMSSMFRFNTAFNQDIGSWNVSSCTNFTNFMDGKSTEYDPEKMDSIFNNWPNYKLTPNLTGVNFGSINYTSDGVEGKALLERPHITASISNIQESASLFQIQATSIADGLSAGNRITISGSGNPVLDKAHAILQVLDINTFTVDVPFTASAIQGEVITGYGWTMITGSQLP